MGIDVLGEGIAELFAQHRLGLRDDDTGEIIRTDALMQLAK
ncbi:MAG: hypothetical protein WBM40_09680 [Thiohalocapsa sp.]